MRVLAILMALAWWGCTPVVVDTLVHTHPFTCDEQCTDRDYMEHYSAKELAELAIWRAGRGNCTCGYALLRACGMKDLGVRNAALRDRALRACVVDVSPAERRDIRIASTAPGTIAACIGDE